MNTIKQTLLNNWNLMRWLRLGIAVFIAIQAIQQHSVFMGFFGVFFLFQALTNTGCCGASGCAVPVKKTDPDKKQEVEYEEIK